MFTCTPRPGTIVFTLAALLVIGCGKTTPQAGQEPDHDHGHAHSHEHTHAESPPTIYAALDELKENWEQICQAMDQDKPDDAHHALHSVGDLLSKMPELATDTDLSESQWNGVKQHIDDLTLSFGAIDSAFHKKDGDKVAAFNSAQSSINEGIASLERELPKLDEATPTQE